MSGACGYGYSCVYSTAISWAAPTTPLPSERDPRVVFERLFGDGATVSRSARCARRQDRQHPRRAFARESRGFRQDLGPGDRSRLTTTSTTCARSSGGLQNVEKHNSQRRGASCPTRRSACRIRSTSTSKLMFDLQVLAFATEMTRVSSFKMGRDVSSRVYPESGVKTPFHALSHHGDKIRRPSKSSPGSTAITSAPCAYFLEKLQNTPDGDGNLLDHSLVLYGSPMADGNRHSHKRLPLFLAGHASGQLKGNLHLKAPLGTPMANVLLTTLHKLGVDDIDRIGDSTGAARVLGRSPIRIAVN